MPCYHPNWACYQDNPRRPVKILGSVEPQRVGGKVWFDGDWRDCWPVPCQQCIGCRLDSSREWANRCVMESLTWPEHLCWFLTLTYADSDLPIIDPKIDTPYPGTLVKDDLSLFAKRLRRSIEYKTKGPANIRIYGCGEYGSHTLRPHYHILVFGLTIPDLIKYKVNFHGDVLYNSPWLESVWGHGYVVVGHFNWLTAAYTARYVTKKIKGKIADEYYSEHGIIPEYTRSSTKPGIAVPYYDLHWQEIYENDRIVLPAVDGVDVICRPPRIFDERYKKEHPIDFDFIKDKRSDCATIARDTLLSRLDGIDEYDYLCELEKIAQKRPQYRLDI